MKKIVCFLLTLTMLCGIAAPAFAESGDVPEGYTPIRTAQELDNIRNNLSGKYILMNDIDLGEYENWVPIGTKKQPFSGIFDGNNHSIKNLIINNFVEDLSRSSSGLFAFVKGSQIINANIESATQNITSGKKAFYCSGLLVGNAYYSTIINCSSSGTVILSLSGACKAGGIAGEIGNGCIVSNCENSAQITVKAVNEIIVGGVFGYSYSPITCCSNKSDLTVASFNQQEETNYIISVGGICGTIALEDITNSYNWGNIKCNNTSDIFTVGGICGESFSVKKCYNIGFIETTSEKLKGGISGIVESITDRPDGTTDLSTVQDCYCLNNIDKIIGNENSAIIKDSEIKSEFDLKQKKTFQEYDFENIWNIDEGKSYPVLKAINRTEPKAQLIGAEIVFVPLKNLIVFGSGDPNTPDGIILLLRFSDGKIRFYTVKENNYEYIVGEFDIEHYGSVTVYRTGFLIDEIVVNGQFELKYIYLSLPDFLGDKL